MASNIPNCPKCNTMMVLRTIKKGRMIGKTFYGCPKFPKCDGTVWEASYEKKEIVKQSMPTNVKGSTEQTAIWDSVQNAASHIIVDALAGTGKTFTITYALQYLKPSMRVILVAFNVHIADELKTRIPDGFEATTMNSFAYRQVRNSMRVRFVKTKLYDILETLIPQKEKNTQFLTQAAYKLVNLVKSNLLDVNNDQDLDDLVLKHSIELNDSRNEIYQIVRNAFRATIQQKNVVDYMDQVYFVYAFDLAVEQYNVFFGDEIQDWNALQQYIMMRAIDRSGIFCGVGDKNQAIYGFSGADTNSIDNLRVMLSKTKRDVITKPLTVTRRCPKSHVAFAQQIVPEIQALDDAKEGTLEQITLDHALTLIDNTHLGICRRNAPLISIAYKLIRNGKTVIVKGRNIGEGLIALINKLRAADITDLSHKAEEYRNKELDKLQKKGNKAEASIQSLNDKIDTLQAFIDEHNDIETMKRAIESMFSEDNIETAITLSSVHRAKGLEANTVFIFEFDRIRIKMNNPEFEEQEAHLDYIARTRSKDTMYTVVG